MFDALQIRNQIIQDYASFVRSFLKVREPHLREFVDEKLDQGILWPDPLIQLNPDYKAGCDIARLVNERILDPLCSQLFVRNGSPINLHAHQEIAIRKALTGKNFVLTSGTGSGKSLAFLIPIVNHILRNNPEHGGVRAIIVYPMNALINSQEQEFQKWLQNIPSCPIRVGRYTGQENSALRDDLKENPPHIVLTNYSMLELMLTRPDEKKLVGSDGRLRFIVLDEMHTHRGRQGADVALLIRRLRERYGTKDMQCFGTSATLSSKGSQADRLQAVANIASKLFGASLSSDDVIEEQLAAKTEAQTTWPSSALRLAVTQIANTADAQEDRNLFLSWCEHNLGIVKEDDIFRRSTPLQLSEAVQQLSKIVDLPDTICLKAFENSLLKSSRLSESLSLPFKLHQFISQGGTVYATLGESGEQEFSVIGKFAATPDQSKLFFPVVFCRECGQEYYLCNLEKEAKSVLPRSTDGALDIETTEAGYLLLDHAGIWSEEQAEDLPDDWFEELRSGGRKLKKDYRKYQPRNVRVTPAGKIAPEGMQSWFVPTPFLACLNCGVVYDKRTKNDYAKLAKLSSEGRSSSTTLLGLSAVQAMRECAVEDSALKLLSFTDNRQDASLQAGHFNDFTTVVRLRMALSNALNALPEDGCLTHENIAQATAQAMSLEIDEYARTPGLMAAAAQEAKRAFHTYIEYRLYEDLRRGWRVNVPNLEQCGLLRITFAGLDEICNKNDIWSGNEYLAGSSPEERYKAIYAILDYMRRVLSISADCLDQEKQEALQKRISQNLRDPWRFEEDEQLRRSLIFVPDSNRRLPGDRVISHRSAIGRFIRSAGRWLNGTSRKLNSDECESIIQCLLKVLPLAGILHAAPENDYRGYQLAAKCLGWRPANGEVPPPDPLRYKSISNLVALERQPNEYFKQLYLSSPATLIGIEGHEHTGQTSRDNREQRELHSTSKCNKRGCDFKRCFKAQAFSGPIVKQGFDAG